MLLIQLSPMLNEADGFQKFIKLFSSLPRLDLFDLDQAGDNRLVLSAIKTLILQFAVSLHHLPLVPIALDSRG